MIGRTFFVLAFCCVFMVGMLGGVLLYDYTLEEPEMTEAHLTVENWTDLSFNITVWAFIGSQCDSISEHLDGHGNVTFLLTFPKVNENATVFAQITDSYDLYEVFVWEVAPNENHIEVIV